VLWGRRERLTELESYKLRVVSPKLPGKWMTGTQNHEGIAGTLAAVQYLADLGRHVAPDATSRREALRAAYRAIADYEMHLAKYLLEQLRPLAKVRVLGISETSRLAERVPTFSILHERLSPVELAEHLGQRGIFAYHGNFYALALSERLGLEPGGMLRIGLLHYNTIEEIDRLTAALSELE
jgi:selenocysteine lyase/cysteine desulfurase